MELDFNYEKWSLDTNIDTVLRELKFLGDNWENDHEEIIDKIMVGRWWDGLIELLKGATEMKRLLTIAREHTCSTDEKTEVLQSSEDNEILQNIELDSTDDLSGLELSELDSKSTDDISDNTSEVASEGTRHGKNRENNVMMFIY